MAMGIAFTGLGINFLDGAGDLNQAKKIVC
jgi:hypothetical protein